MQAPSFNSKIKPLYQNKHKPNPCQPSKVPQNPSPTSIPSFPMTFHPFTTSILLLSLTTHWLHQPTPATISKTSPSSRSRSLFYHTINHSSISSSVSHDKLVRLISANYFSHLVCRYLQKTAFDKAIDAEEVAITKISNPTSFLIHFQVFHFSQNHSNYG